MHTNPYQGLKLRLLFLDNLPGCRYNAHESLSGIETSCAANARMFFATSATMHTNPYQGLKQ